MNNGTALVIGILLALLILIPTALYGGKHEIALPLAASLIIILILLTRYLPANQNKSLADWLLLAFLGWIIINALIFSKAPYTSIISALPIFAGGLIFLVLQSIQFDKTTLKTFSYLLLIGTTAIILFGYYVYLSPKFSSLRMGATFRQHNALAGFLTALLPLSLYALLFAEKWRLLFWSIIILITTSLILTFSRGGFIAAGAGLLIFLFLLWRQSGWQKLVKSTVSIILLSAISGSLAYGLYSAKTANFANVGITTAASPYADERPETGETAVNARLEYWRAAWQIFNERPLTGTGLNTFEQEYRRIQTDPRFFSVDPHNIVFKLLAELGLIGTIIFFAFVATVLWPAARLSFATGKSDLLQTSIFAGTVGLLIHYGGDLDLTFPAHYIIFFTLIALLAKSKENSDSILKPRIKFYSLTSIASVLLFLTAASIYAAGYYFDRAKLTYADNGDLTKFDNFLATSSLYNPLDPYRSLTAAEIYLQENRYTKALIYAKKAERVQSYNRDTQLLTGKILATMGQNEQAEKALRLAITYAPARDLETYVYLVNLLQKTGQAEEAKTMAKTGLAYFPDSVFESSLWVNYTKAEVALHRFLLTAYLETN